MTKTFLPITKKEVETLGWEMLDVIIITGDAYVDHPSFGAAIIGRIIEQEGLKVGLVPQPNWRDDWRDFKKMGKPRLFFGITAGNMDSMVNHYTANKRLRSDDAYTPGGKAGFRPDYATKVYTKIVKELFPDVPVVIGGIEASMRRLSHYDFWQDQLLPSILIDTQADILVYGMGEKPIKDLIRAFQQNDWKKEIRSIPQIAYLEQNVDRYQDREDVLFLHSYKDELKNKKCYGENFVAFEVESNKRKSRILVQAYEKQYLIVNPPNPVATESEMDSWAMFDKMMNAPHPKYAKRGTIPAFEMIKNSVTMHRGCFGGCSFCTISAHQGKFIASRSEASILAEVEDLCKRDYFKGHISDLGGPSANMYQMEGIDPKRCSSCRRNSCLYPEICPNLNRNHRPLLSMYQKVRNIPSVKKVTIGSGIRYEMLLSSTRTEDEQFAVSDYLKAVVQHHVSGRLKVAPEHTSTRVTKMMRKPSFDKFSIFLKKFNQYNRESGKNQQLIPYFISAHPGCSIGDMAALAVEAKKNGLHTDQVQQFTPTPMTFSTALYYLGFDPYTGEKVFVSRTTEERKLQHLFFFYYKKENKHQLSHAVRKNQDQIKSQTSKDFFSYICRR